MKQLIERLRKLEAAATPGPPRLVDPRDGVLRVFATVFDEQRRPVKRVELEVEK